MVTHPLFEDFAVEVTLRFAECAGIGDGCAFLRKFEERLRAVELRPVRKAAAVWISGLREIGPVGFHEVGECAVDFAKISGNVSALWKIAEDIRQIARVHRTLRFLAGDGGWRAQIEIRRWDDARRRAIRLAW
jgi:hypothetical protein